MKKHLKLFSLIALAIAGLGVSFVAVKNEVVSEPEVKKADAASVYPDTLYFTIVSAWNSSYALKDMSVKFTGGTYAGETKKFSDLSNVVTHTDRVNPIIEFPRFGATSIQISCNGTKSRVATIPQSENGALNMLVAHNNSDDRRVQWASYSETTTNANSATLYVAPCYDWCNSYWEYEYCYPYLRVYDGSTLVYDAVATGTCYKCSLRNNEKHFYVFYFTNVPIIANGSFVISHSFASTVSGWGDINKFTISDTTNFGTSWNMVGTSDDDSPSTVSTYNYCSDESKAFITGSFSEYGSAIPSARSGFPSGHPTAAATLQKQVIGGNAYYTKTMKVDALDVFKYNVYSHLSNTSSNGNSSSVEYTGDAAGTVHDAVSYGTVDSNVTVQYNGSSAGITKTDYVITTENGIQFKRGGMVELKRTSVGSAGAELIINFLTDSRTSEPKSTDPQYLMIEAYEGYSSAEYQFEYYPSRGRYETVVAAIGGEELIFVTTKDDDETIVSKDGFETLHDADADYDDETDVITLNDSSTFYAIGWYPYNDSGERKLMFFVDKMTTPGSQRCAEALCKTIEPIRSCTCDSGTKTKLKVLYDSCALYYGANNLNTDMSNYNITDYDRASYYFNDKDYTKTAKIYDVDAYTKYQFLQTGIAHSLSMRTGILELENTSDELMTIIIVLSSISLIGISMTTTMLVRKKKKN